MPYGFVDKLAHTYSIVARDPENGEMGIAVQSHYFSVGKIVPWAEAGIGAIATQSLVNAAFGPDGLELLRSGKTAQEALDEMIAADEGEKFRQLAIVDAKGNVATHTGSHCIPAAGHATGDQFSVQANLMLNDSVWPAMAQAFEASTGPLAERLIITLATGENAGGDIRGRQSAAILVVKAEPSGKLWEDRMIELRVEDHPEPVEEIGRLLKIYRAYKYMDAGDEAMAEDDREAALKAYTQAETLYPENVEIRYWHAVSLANAGALDDAISIFKEVFAQDDNWRELTQRLPQTTLLSVSDEDLKRIVSKESS